MAVRKGKITALSAGAAGKGGGCSEMLQTEQIPGGAGQGSWSWGLQVAARQQAILPKLKPVFLGCFCMLGVVLVLLSCLATRAALPLHPSSWAGVDVMGAIGLQRDKPYRRALSPRDEADRR